MNKNIYGVILAGGSGSRLWPLSREMYPKQLLSLVEEKSFFQSTFLRLNNLISSENILTITNEKHVANVKIQLEELNEENNINSVVIGEPVGRNTAPAIALAALFVKNNLAEKDSDPVVIVAPSDHLIKDNKAFMQALQEGVKIAEDGYIVTFGIQPSRPDIGYGYIKTFEDNSISGEGLKVEEFKEKPNLVTAKKYLELGNYFWNSGIFMFKVSTIMEEMQLYSREILDGLNQIDLTSDSINKAQYEQIPSISIDYALMEKSNKIALVPVDCGWSDLGSWEAVCDVSEKNADNNFIKGDVVAIDSQNSFIYSSSRQVSVIGMDDVIVIETDDAVLVCDKKQSQKVKDVFEGLKKQNSPLYLKHVVVKEEWGSSALLSEDGDFITKKIIIKSGKKLVFPQKNNAKSSLCLVSGTGLLVSQESQKEIKSGDTFELSFEKEQFIENKNVSDLIIVLTSNFDF